MNHREQIDELLAQAAEMRNGPAKLALTEDAVHRADHHNDVAAGFDARLEYVSAALFAGMPDRMLVAFSWMLSQFDRNPDAFDAHRLLWQYKWVVNALPDFPQITRAQIEAMFVDMERRYREFGASMQTIAFKKRGVACKMGDFDAAADANRAMASLRRDELSDCLACEMDAQIEYHFIRHEYEQGVTKAGPILRGRYTCSEVPQVTYAQLLLPLLRLDRGDEAMRHHRVGYKMIANNPVEFIPQLAEHLEFLTLTENLPRAVRLLEKHLVLALESPCPAWRFRFFLSAKLLFERLAESGRDAIKLRLPETLPARTESGSYRPHDLANWFAADLTEWAERFDARNGNNHYCRRIDDGAELKTLARAVPIPKLDDDSTRYER